MRITTPIAIARSVGLALLVVAVPCRADQIWLTHGEQLEGHCEDLGNGKVRITLDFGALTLPASHIARIEQGSTLAERLQRQLAELSPNDAEGRYALARQARKEGAETLARRLLEQVLAVDPNHAAARRELGYTWFQDQWRTAEEVHLLRGDVEFQGEWMSRQERARILAVEAEVAAESQRRRQEAQERAELERAAAERELAIAQRLADRQVQGSTSLGQSWSYVPTVYVAYGNALPAQGVVAPSSQFSSPTFPIFLPGFQLGQQLDGLRIHRGYRGFRLGSVTGHSDFGTPAIGASRRY